MVTSFAIPLVKNVEHLCLPFIPEARPLSMIYRILCSTAPSNSLTYFTASPLSQARDLPIGLSFHFLTAPRICQLFPALEHQHLLECTEALQSEFTAPRVPLWWPHCNVPSLSFESQILKQTFSDHPY